MALSIDRATKIISVPQADLTLVSGTLYDCDIDALRLDIKNQLEASEEGMVEDDVISHNTEVSVAGVTYARIVEVVNSYQVQFTPDSQWSVRLIGSNNNIFDIQNAILVQNQVQVIPTNSAGLQIVVQGSGMTEQDKVDIVNLIFAYAYEGSETFAQYLRLTRSVLLGVVVKLGNIFSFRDKADNKTRVTGTTDGANSRTSVEINDAD